MNDALEKTLDEDVFAHLHASSALGAPLRHMHMRSGWLALLAIAGAGLFCWLAIWVVSGDSLTLDIAILRMVGDYRALPLKSLALLLSRLVVTSSVLILVYLLYRRWWRIALFWFCSSAGVGVLASLAKKAAQRHRPELWTTVSSHATFSFPSGHATQSMAIVVALMLIVPPRWRLNVLAGSAVFVCLVGACRLYLGMHYPTDILAGWVLSIGWVSLLALLFGVGVAHRR